MLKINVVTDYMAKDLAKLRAATYLEADAFVDAFRSSLVRFIEAGGIQHTEDDIRQILRKIWWELRKNHREDNRY